MSVKNTHVTHKVWSRFQATQKDGSIIKLRIQDLPWEQHKDNLAEFYMKYFIKDEAFHKAAGIFNNQEAETEYREIVFSYYGEKELQVSICCLDDDSNTNDILGMSLVMELNKSQSEDNVDGLKPKTKEVQNLFHIISLIHDIKPSKDHEKYYEGRGIIVRPDLRGLGIANEFVRLRKQICIDNNIQMSSAWMTSIGTQKAAAKNNWKTFMELPVEEFETRTGLLFEADTPTNADIGALKYELPKFWKAWFFIFFIAAICPTVRILYTWVMRIDNTYGFYAYIMEYHLMMISVLQFIIIAFYINTALEAVNDKLLELMSAMVNGKKKPNRLKMAHRPRILCKAFVLTCKVLKEFNTHMNCVFVTFYLYFILDFSYHLYTAMNYLQVDNLNTNQYLEIIGVWLRLIFNIIQSIMFVEPFYRAKVEFSRMRLTVCRMMSLVNFGDPMLDDLHAFFKQLLLNIFSYTASGLFSLERNVTYTMIGVIATVLSILQEFMNAADN